MHRLATRASVALFALFALTPAIALAQALPPGFQITNAITGRSDPTAVRFARDGRVYIAQKSGQIYEYDHIADTTGTQIADLRTNVHNFWDRGLLGLELDPDFPDEPYLYVLYTFDAGIGGTAPRWGSVGGSGDNCGGALSNGGPTASNGGCVLSGRLSRLTLSGGSTVEQVLVNDWFQQYPSHSIGTVLIGADGFLYAGAGDGASFNFTDWGQAPNPNFPDPDSPTDEGGALRSQDLRTAGDPLTLSGSIIRVDRRTGDPAPGNPRFGAAGASANERRMVAYGFRNPFRITRRPGTSELWIGDVGWNDFEEIDVLPDLAAAAQATPPNFGWPCYEGPNRQGGYDGANRALCESLYAAPAGAHRAPFYAYRHSIAPGCGGVGSAIAGLAFYIGTTYPAEWLNALFFADYNRNQIFAFKDADLDRLPDPPTLSGCVSGPEPTPYAFTGSSNIVDLVAGPGGDLFAVALNSGVVRRIHFGSNRAPSAAVRVQAGSTVAGGDRIVVLDATNSVDPDPATILDFDWDLDGDGQFDDLGGTGASTAPVMLAGNRIVRVGVQVADAAGGSDSATLRLYAGNAAPTAQIVSPAAPLPTWRVGDMLPFAGLGTDPELGNLTGNALEWDLILHHCSDETFMDCHSHTITSANGNHVQFDAPDHEYPSYLRIVLTARDASDETDDDTVDLFPDVAEVTLASDPTGLALVAGSAAATPAPFVHKAIANGEFSVSAATQLLASIEYVFASWSDGREASHLVRFPQPGPATLTATFARNADVSLALSGPYAEFTYGAPYTYTLTLANSGGGLVPGSAFSHTPPATVQSAAWTCTATGGATCPAPGGTGAIAMNIDISAGGSLAFRFDGSMSAAPPPTFTLQAALTPPVGFVDPDATDNAVQVTLDTVVILRDGFEG